MIKRFASYRSRGYSGYSGGGGGGVGVGGIGGGDSQFFDEQRATVGSMLLMTQAKDAVQAHNQFDSLSNANIDQGQAAQWGSLSMPLSSSNPSAVLQSLALRRQATPASSLAMVV